MNENLIVRLEKERIVTATFRKLDPNKKRNVYLAGLNVFSESAYDRVTLDEIAARAAISKGSLIQYFVNKENLLEFIGRIFLDEYRQSWEEYFRIEKSIRAADRLNDYLFHNIIQWQNKKNEFNFLGRQLNENPGQLTERFIKKIVDIQQLGAAQIIERGIKTGEVRGDISSGFIVLIIQGILEKILRLYSYRFTGRINESRLAGDIKKYIRIIFEGAAA